MFLENDLFHVEHPSRSRPDLNRVSALHLRSLSWPAGEPPEAGPIDPKHLFPDRNLLEEYFSFWKVFENLVPLVHFHLRRRIAQCTIRFPSMHIHECKVTIDSRWIEKKN